MANDLVSHLGHIVPIGYADAQSDHGTDSVGRPNSSYRKGQLMMSMDDFGPRIFRYMHNTIGAVTKAGGLYSRAADVAVASIDASTTLLIKKAAGYTASALIGWVANYITNNTSPGTAPEGESGIVVSNTAGVATLDSSRPLSATPNAADAVTFRSLFDFIAAASADKNHAVMGIAVATNGISDKNWGVLQQFGFCPDAKCKSNSALTTAVAIIAHTEQVTVSSTSADDLLIGYSPFTRGGTNSGKALVFIDVFSPMALTA